MFTWNLNGLGVCGWGVGSVQYPPITVVPLFHKTFPSPPYKKWTILVHFMDHLFPPLFGLIPGVHKHIPPSSLWIIHGNVTVKWGKIEGRPFHIARSIASLFHHMRMLATFESHMLIFSQQGSVGSKRHSKLRGTRGSGASRNALKNCTYRFDRWCLKIEDFISRWM